MLTKRERLNKRGFDIIFSFVGLVFTFPLIFVSFLAIVISSRTSGIYAPYRIGRHGLPFKIYKLKTMREVNGPINSVTTKNDPRITSIGKWLRKFKIDELPQLWNVLKGEMSLVGPRPDVAGFADQLQGQDREILSLLPGITGLATLKFKQEEELLAQQKDPIAYNREVIWPEKIKLNREYIKNYSFGLDVQILWKTIVDS
ncbi:lipopolysaccharide/colanic/teichoic acid biosynthesis glycosyltransferase [Mesonia algae]|uniref:Lipopolysaccharide/colanic/teichoic acid biosynthesis glycosyltransferase n=1 Tax=Mesonia algae TaxID=213248 RepID=A0A2W7IA12_9FLAO|nr:sugar transferase [Mesonia algae]PZW43736.1 lipopolysaccharide/colanic/teichoic acid biosynthesis glycosyltransferase [Mesonia algae]